MKKYSILITLVILLIFSKTALGAEAPAAYDLGDGYTAVRNDVFDKLAENDQLLTIYKEEAEYYKGTLEQYILLADERRSIQDARITLLKDTVGLKDEVIKYKDSQIANYSELYQIKKDEASRKTFNTWFDKLLLLGLGAYAVDQIDDSTGRVAVGALTIYLFNR